MEYTKLIDISLCHEYFNGSSCGFHVTPSPETSEILNRVGALCRIYDGKIRVTAPMNAFDKEEKFFFYVKASIAEVWNVTSFEGVAHDEFPVIVADYSKTTFEGREKKAIPELNRMFGVMFALELHIKPNESLVCNVTIPSKKLRWCYCVSGCYAERNLQINDSLKAEEPVEFDCVERSQRLSLYVSRCEIPIVSGAPSRFQLLDSSTSKVLIKSLPNASGKTLAKARLCDGTRAIVAECFVNP